MTATGPYRGQTSRLVAVNAGALNSAECADKPLE